MLRKNICDGKAQLVLEYGKVVCKEGTDRATLLFSCVPRQNLDRFFPDLPLPPFRPAATLPFSQCHLLLEVFTSRKVVKGLLGPILALGIPYGFHLKSIQLHPFEADVHRASSLLNGGLRDAPGRTCVFICHSGRRGSLPGQECTPPQPWELLLL